MQATKKEFDPNKHDKFKALYIRQPFAQSFADGYKTIYLGRQTDYRGDVLLCSTIKPYYINMDCGATLAFAELYQTKPAEELTEDEWWQTIIPPAERNKTKAKKDCYAWFFRNIRKVIEFPLIRTNIKGLCNLYYTKGLIMEYPTHIILDIL